MRTSVYNNIVNGCMSLNSSVFMGCKPPEKNQRMNQEL